MFPPCCLAGVQTVHHASTRDSWTLTGKSDSVSCRVNAPFSWVLMCTMFCLCPPRVCFPSSVEVLFWVAHQKQVFYKYLSHRWVHCLMIECCLSPFPHLPSTPSLPLSVSLFRACCKIKISTWGNNCKKTDIYFHNEADWKQW